MTPDRDQFEAQLAQDVRYLYSNGLAEKVEAVTIPAFAELAVQLSNAAYDRDDYYCEAVRGAFSQAMAAPGRQRRKEGLEKLLGLDQPGFTQTRRLENAAHFFDNQRGQPYKNGESLRRSKPNDRPATDQILEELVCDLLRLADNRNFSYSGRFSDRPEAESAAVDGTSEEPPPDGSTSPSGGGIAESATDQASEEPPPDDPAAPSGKEPSKALVPAPREKGAASRRIGKRSVAAGLVVLLVIAIVVIALPSGGSASQIPPPGSVVNAMTGKVDSHAVNQGVPKGGPQIAGGPNFQACNLSAGAPCSDLRPRHPVVSAHAGDIINFKLRVFNPIAKPLPYATFETTWGSSRNPSQLAVTMNIEWLYAHHGGFGVPELDPLAIASPTAVNASDLVYIPGSTMLLSRTGQMVGRLPDGIMGSGIALSHIGSPHSCSPCAFAYARYISFKARLK